MSDKAKTEVEPKRNPKNIHDAILAVYDEVGYVAKRGTVEIAKDRKYKYAGESEFIAALRPEMIVAGIYQQPLSVSVVTNERVDIEKEWSGKVTKSFQHRVAVLSTYRFMHAPSGTYIDVPAIGEGMDSGDKAFNKAMTIANKYAIRQLFMIETGDDPDKYASKENGGVDDKEPSTKAEFETDDARKLFLANCLEAIGKCENGQQLKDLKELNLAKWNAMGASPVEADRKAWDAIKVNYNAKHAALAPKKTVEAAAG